MSEPTRKRRRKGTGGIDSMPDGTFVPRMPGGGGRLRACSTYDEAEALLDAAISTLAEEGVPADPNAQTLRSIGDGFLTSRRKKSAWKTDRSRFQTHCLTAPFADWPLHTVQPHDGRRWIAEVAAKRVQNGNKQKRRRRKVVARQTVANVLNLMRCAFTYAEQHLNLIQVNPFASVQLPPPEAHAFDPWTWLEPHEQQALLSCESIPIEARLLISFCMGTGMRQGEVWNLELRDLDVDARRITVRFGSAGKGTKGKRIRRIPLFGIALDAATAWLPTLKRRKNPHGLVWPTATGCRRQKGKRPRGWAQWLAAAGIVAGQRHDRRPVRWHDLRHTCGSSLVAGWWGKPWPIMLVRDFLGHRSVTTTERYSHLSASALDAAATESDVAMAAEANVPNPTPTNASGGSSDADSDGPKIAPRNRAKMLNTLAPPIRIERTTFGLGNRKVKEQQQQVESLRGAIVGQSELALEALAALESNDPAAVALLVRKLGSVAAKAVAARPGKSNRKKVSP